jgi:hypothetical protein
VSLWPALKRLRRDAAAGILPVLSTPDWRLSADRPRLRGNFVSPETFVCPETFETFVLKLFCPEMCESSELSELSRLSEAASHGRCYASSFWNVSDAEERSGKVVK